MRVFGIIYFIAICATGLFQTVLIAEGIEYCTGLGDFTTNTLALITTYIPIVGSGLAVYGAVNVLDWGLIPSLLLLFWYVPAAIMVALVYTAVSWARQ